MCRNRPLQAQAEAMLPGEDIADNSTMVDHAMVDARIDIQVVRAAEGMEAGEGYLCVAALCSSDNYWQV